MLTNLLQKHLVWQEHRDSMMKHGCVVRPTMFLASLDIKTVFDDGRPRHVAKLVEGHSTHGWLISALMSEMSELHERATIECVDSVFVFNRCLRQGSTEAQKLWQTMAIQLLSVVEERLKAKDMGLLLISRMRRRDISAV